MFRLNRRLWRPSPEHQWFLADNAGIYSSLVTNQEAIWGAKDRTIDYQYDANGALTRKLTYTTNEQYPETNFIEKVVYSYNLQGLLGKSHM